MILYKPPEKWKHKITFPPFYYIININGQFYAFKSVMQYFYQRSAAIYKKENRLQKQTIFSFFSLFSCTFLTIFIKQSHSRPILKPYQTANKLFHIFSFLLKRQYHFWYWCPRHMIPHLRVHIYIYFFFIFFSFSHTIPYGVALPF